MSRNTARSLGEKVPAAVRRVTGKLYWKDLTANDRLEVAERCLRDARVAHGMGEDRRALDHLQDARSLIAEARQEVQGE